MSRGTIRVVVGAAVIVAAVAYLIWGGVREAIVYFYTPSELQAQGERALGKRLRLGGMVEAGSLTKDPDTLTMEFRVTDGTASIPVRFKGIPPDLFTEGKGAVVEGSWTPEGVFRSDLIMAKHSEEYHPPAKGEEPPSPKVLYKSLMKGEGS
ncbi:MAG: cytochrome c maturation protein CcmE [Candidatus Methylomirabilales bacterium]